MSKPPCSCLVSLALLALSGVAAADNGTLRIVATHIRSDEGSLVIGVYNDAKTWLSADAAISMIVPVAGNRQGDSVTVELPVPPGAYAVSLFQDINGDGQLSTNFLGIPKEPTGTSNNGRPAFRAPRFSNGLFNVAAGETIEQQIWMK